MNRIIYFGSDIDFRKSIRELCDVSRPRMKFEEHGYRSGSIINACSESPVTMIFMDFSEPNIKPEEILNETLYVKKVSKHKPVLFVAIFENEFQKIELANLFVSGFHLSHIKGTELETLIRDSVYMGLRINSDFPVLAVAKNINKPLSIGICSVIKTMTENDFVVETDVEGLTESLSLKLKMYPDLKCQEFQIRDHAPFAETYPMMATYTLAYPYVGPWEEESEQNILPSTVETWLQNFQNEFEDFHRMRILILTSDVTIMRELYDCELDKVIIECQHEHKSLEDELLNSRPSIIFLNLDENVDGPINITLLNFLLTRKFLSSGYKPIIIVANSISSDVALKKAYNYANMLSMPGTIDAKLVVSLTTKFLKKKTTELNLPSQNLKASSTYLAVDVLQSVMITSLTEHEITFQSQLELPYFTVLHFDLPLDFHATIVPPFYKLERRADQFHYMAFIHGLSEDQLMKLRKFINQIIYTPLKDFHPDSIKNILRLSLENKNADKTTTEIQHSSEKKEIAPIEIIKPLLSGKSKL